MPPAGRIAVLLPYPLAGAYDYAVVEGPAPAPGTFVLAPLGPRRVIGVVWGSGDGAVADDRLKPLHGALEVPPMPAVQRRFIDWVAHYTMSPPGAVLKMALSGSGLPESPRPVLVYRRSDRPWPAGLKVTPARRRVLAVFDHVPALTLADLSREAGCGQAVVRGLAEAGVLDGTPVAQTALAPVPDWTRPGPTLSPDQAAAAATLRRMLDADGFSVTLLDGVTGSGKTEVYLEAVATCLARGRQVLVLLPEIALGAQWLDRFARRFGVAPHTWHSDMTAARRHETWHAVAQGLSRIVVGARSALFLPFPDLGLIVVDEEHDAGFKQDDGVIYHARDMAVVRAHLAGIPVVLASATPSLETVTNVEASRYGRIVLPHRHGGAVLPDIALVDLRTEPPGREQWLGPRLRSALAEALAAGEQAMLFLNRRGYAPLTLCRACGHQLRCPQCAAWLVEHRLRRRRLCHHCGHVVPQTDRCPACGETGVLHACGPGVERIAEEAAALFPHARALLLTSDTLHGPASVAEAVRRITQQEVDLVIGTQVVAKGHHFPMLTLVGVVDADLGLSGGDLRAAERTYQLLHQVAGRAGRAERPGRVLLQSYQPDHPVMVALADGDRDHFLALESGERQAMGWPPFGRLVALIVSGTDEPLVDEVSTTLGRVAPRSDRVDVLGPAPAPLALLRGRHRRRLLLRAERGIAVQTVVARWLEAVTVPSKVRVQIDVDPYSFL